MYIWNEQCVCAEVCLYMWAYICIHTVPVDLFICICVTLMTLAMVHIPRWESFSAMIRVPRRTSGTVDLGCTLVQIDAHERIFQPFSWHWMVEFPALLLTPLTQDHGMWWQWKLVVLLRLKRKTSASALPLCGPACCRGSVQTEWDGGDASVSSGAYAAEFAAEPWRRQLPPSVYPIFV